MRHDHERDALARAERAAEDESPRLKEAGAADFGSDSVRNGRARAARAGVLVDRSTQE